ncbi:MAG: NADH-quinone oxidoreductase subunit NuoH [Terriglobia bacterium]
MEAIVHLLSQWVPGFIEWPELAKNLLGMLLASVFCLVLILIFLLVANWGERKIAAHMQDRLGPMRVGGWHGWAQSLADGIKMLLKEDIIPGEVDKFLFKLAPFVLFGGAFAAYVVLPFSREFIPADLNVGVLYAVSISSLGVIGIIMAGWASNNKYALFGGMRAAAQIVSYEIPAIMSILTVIIMVGSLSMQDIVRAQTGGFLGVGNWFLFRPVTFFAFLIYFVSSLAEVNRTPFDIPEAESELVAGYHTEYSGMRFAFFMISEYGGMLLVSGIATTLFLGGWSGPFVSGMGIFLGKMMFLVFVQMWLRWTLPRIRVDQLMYVCWKVLLPISFLLVIVQGALAIR